MNRPAKYLSLAILLTFMVGQVQYSYTSYFCNMLNRYIASPSASLTIHPRQHFDGCSECQAVHVRNQVLEPNCFQVDTFQKDVVSNFVTPTNFEVHMAVAFVISLPQPVVQQATLHIMSIPRTSLSPPLDLPTLNGSLLI